MFKDKISKEVVRERLKYPYEIKAQENSRGAGTDKPSKGHFRRGKGRRAGVLRQSARGLAKCRTWRADAGERRQLRGIYRLSGRGRRIRGNVGGSSRQQTPLA